MNKKQRVTRYRVYLVNVQTIGAGCGWGEGKTLREAQEDALRLARERNPKSEPQLSEGGDQVFFEGGINC